LRQSQLIKKSVHHQYSSAIEIPSLVLCILAIGILAFPALQVIAPIAKCQGAGNMRHRTIRQYDLAAAPLLLALGVVLLL
jgi:hypothetical protein